MKKSDNSEIILSQWKTCVEMADSVSKRRDTMNNIFVTLNLAIIASVLTKWDVKSILMLITGCSISIIWIILIKNYKILNREKFEVINKIEKQLPMKPFNNEWKKLKENKSYYDSTKLEVLLPMIFIILYLLSTLIILYNIDFYRRFLYGLQFIYKSLMGVF